ncbi:MAG: hypothetical protein R6U96_02325 [Promethearchaeia archaeon]
MKIEGNGQMQAFLDEKFSSGARGHQDSASYNSSALPSDSDFAAFKQQTREIMRDVRFLY